MYKINKKMLHTYTERVFKINSMKISENNIKIIKKEFEKYYLKINNLKNKKLIFIYE